MPTRTPRASRDFARYASASAAALGATTVTHAQFTGNYALTPPSGGSYTHNDSGNTIQATHGAFQTSVFVNTADSVTLNTGLGPNSVSLSTTAANTNSAFLEIFLTAPGTIPLSFNYSISGVSGTPLIGYIHNGSFSTLTGASGSISFTQNAGQMFGFEITNNYTVGGATLTISNFTQIPEPGATTLLSGIAATGFVGLIAARKRRQRAAVATTA